jgi:hypothetical protein
LSAIAHDTSNGCLTTQNSDKMLSMDNPMGLSEKPLGRSIDVLFYAI